MSQLHIVEVRRVSRDGEVWRTRFEPGFNIIFGPQNSSKTTTLRIIDFCFGDGSTASNVFGDTIAEEYERFELDIRVDDTLHTLTRNLHAYRQTTLTQIGDQRLDTAGVSNWLLDVLGWQSISIPKGVGQSVTEEIPLTFRSLFRHIYRESDSWVSFASQEHEYFRRAVFSYFIGIAEPIYRAKNLELAIRRSELEAKRLEERTRETATLVDRFLKSSSLDGQEAHSMSEASFDGAIAHLDEQARALMEEAARLKTGVREEPGFDHAANGRLGDLNQDLSDSENRVSELRQTIEDQQRLIDVLHADELRIDRAAVSTRALHSFLVTACPACYQPITPPASEEGQDDTFCYVCSQPVGVDVRSRRLGLEMRAVVEERNELMDMVGALREELSGAEAALRGLSEARQRLLDDLERERQHLISPVLSELSDIQFRLGELDRQKSIAIRLKNITSDVMQESKSARSIVESELVKSRRELGKVFQDIDDTFERTLLVAEYIQEFVSQVDGFSGLGGSVFIDSRSLQFYIGSEQWDTALGDERKVIFLLAYQYALLRLASEVNIPFPRLCILDNPFQQGIDDLTISSCMQIYSRLLEANSSLQVVVSSTRRMNEINAHRVEFTRVFNAEEGEGL